MIFDETNTISFEKYPNTFVYFLIRDDEVVYVGQTRRGGSRIYQHTDKVFDRVEILPVDESLLDIAEDKYIRKYKPLYNKRMNTVMNFTYKEAKRKLSEATGMSIRDTYFKKLLQDFHIEPYLFNSCVYIAIRDFIKLYNFLMDGDKRE